jgi:uncharacterized iron-regulated membrane protein
MRLDARSIRTWRLVHTWTSLLSTLFLLLLCVTGLPLIFKDEIDDWIYQEPEAVVAARHEGPTAPLDLSVRTASERFPGEYIHFFFWHSDRPHIVTFGLSPAARSIEPPRHAVTIDTRSAQVVDLPKPRRGVTFYLLKLHTDLFLNLPGKLFLGAMGVMMVAALVSGAVLYGPFMRKLDFGRRSSRAARWLDLHNLLGIATLTWALVVGVTGAFNTLAAPLFDLWRARELPELIAQYKDRPLPQQLASVDRVVAMARDASPGMRLVSVVYPYSRFTTPRHYLIWTKGTTPLTEHLFAPVLIDAETGEFTGVLKLPFYVRALELARPLHFGNYGGLPLKLIWAVLDMITIAVLVSGLYLWLRRKRFAGIGSAGRVHGPGVKGRMNLQQQKRRVPVVIFAAPVLLSLVTILGLLSALIADGAWDAMSWIALSVPIFIVAAFVSRS